MTKEFYEKMKEGKPKPTFSLTKNYVYAFNTWLDMYYKLYREDCGYTLTRMEFYLEFFEHDRFKGVRGNVCPANQNR